MSHELIGYRYQGKTLCCGHIPEDTDGAEVRAIFAGDEAVYCDIEGCGQLAPICSLSRWGETDEARYNRLLEKGTINELLTEIDWRVAYYAYVEDADLNALNCIEYLTYRIREILGVVHV